MEEIKICAANKRKIVCIVDESWQLWQRIVSEENESCTSYSLPKIKTERH